MLSIRNTVEINRLILAEMQTARSICSTHLEKLEAIQRAEKLKKLLVDRPEEQPQSCVRTRPKISEIFHSRR